MLKIILTKGLPAAGKTQWARQMCEKGPYKRVNKDDLRAMINGGVHSNHSEKRIIAARDALVKTLLAAGNHVIVDDTNFNPVHEQRMREIAQEMGAEVEIKVFDTPLEECIARDRKRVASVGVRVIMKMYNQYLRHTEALEQDETKPKAIICDIDGTLALMNGRDPYDASKCESDLLNEPVFELICEYARRGENVILLSGREDKFREQTENWLMHHKVLYNKLLMRKAGDMRKDAIIKEEILRAEILPNYFIRFVLDDRDQVVRMWRNVGLTCFQVAEGDF